MAFDTHKNLAISSVATAPSPSTTGTSLIVAAGEGARFPAPPFNATVWPTSAAPTPANAEIVRVTAVATNTLTIVRAQEGSTARAIANGDLIAASITAKLLTDIETQAAIKDAANVFTQNQTIQKTLPKLTLMDMAQSAGQRGWVMDAEATDFYIRAVDDAGVVQLYPLCATRGGELWVQSDIHEKGRVTALGHWIAEPYNPAHFTAQAPLTWTVSAGAFKVNRYALVGNVMIWDLIIEGSTLGGTAASALFVTVPGGKAAVAPSMMAGQGHAVVAGAWQAMMINKNGTQILVYRAALAAYPNTGTLDLHFSITLAIT